MRNDCTHGQNAGLPAAADEGTEAADTPAADQLVREPALADPRLTDEQEQATPSGEGVLESRLQLRELGLAADEDPSRRVR